MPNHDVEVDVAIVGAGPTGLALACELRLAGVSCTVLERRAAEPNITRAFAIHARTLELLEGRGMAEELVGKGIPITEIQPAPGASLRLNDLPTRYQMVLLIAQSGTERMLERRATESGAVIRRGARVTGLAQDADGVTLTLDGGKTMRASYVVGADGAHSAVRDLIGVDFVGAQYETHIMLADVQLQRPPGDTLFAMRNEFGLVLFVPFGDGWFRAIVWDRTREDVPLDEPLTLDELRASFLRIAGDDYGMGEPRWRTRFLSERRQARKYRVGRVFLAGDAAHVHSPIGGQGMNTGIQDAFNLGWKLAFGLKGWGPPDLLDTYERERHPVGESVLKLTDALYKLVLSGSSFGAAWRQAAIRLAVRVGPVRRRLAERLTGIAIRYSGGPHPLVGRRMPGGVDPSGRFTLMAPSPVDVLAWKDRVTVVGTDGPYALVRPDGYVAWAGSDAGRLHEAVKAWCDGAR